MTERVCHCGACKTEGQHDPWCEVHSAVWCIPSGERAALPCDCGQREGKRRKLDVPRVPEPS